MIVILKVTKTCNLRCSYCYMDLSESGPTMSMPVVEAVINKFGGAYDNVTYAWHGGEPLIAGIDFFRDILIKQREFYKALPKASYLNTIQTNGTLLTDEWLEFLQTGSFGLGFSYDGPGRAGKLRMDRNGTPIGPKLEQTFRRLRKVYQYSPGVICVVSRVNVDHPHTIYRHFKDIGLGSFTLSPYFGWRKELGISPDEYYVFHKEIFDLWIDDSEPFEGISPFREIISSCLDGRKFICSWDGRCFGDMVSIEPDGRVFLCGAFYGDEHCIGNILSDSLDEIFQHPNYIRAMSLQEGVLAECESCDVFSFCKGGCREMSYYSYGDMSKKDPMCKGRHALVKHIITQFSEAVKRAYCLSGKANNKKKGRVKYG